MSVEVALRNILVGNAAVIAICSTRIYPEQRPQGTTLPAICYSLDFSQSVGQLDGNAAMQTHQMDFSCMHTAKSTTETLADAVVAALDGLSGTYSSVSICQIRWLSADTAWARLDNGDDSIVYIKQVSFLIQTN